MLGWLWLLLLSCLVYTTDRSLQEIAGFPVSYAATQVRTGLRIGGNNVAIQRVPAWQYSYVPGRGYITALGQWIPSFNFPYQVYPMQPGTNGQPLWAYGQPAFSWKTLEIENPLAENPLANITIEPDQVLRDPGISATVTQISQSFEFLEPGEEQELKLELSEACSPIRICWKESGCPMIIHLDLEDETHHIAADMFSEAGDIDCLSVSPCALAKKIRKPLNEATLVIQNPSECPTKQEIFVVVGFDAELDVIKMFETKEEIEEIQEAPVDSFLANVQLHVKKGVPSYVAFKIPGNEISVISSVVSFVSEDEKGPSAFTVNHFMLQGQDGEFNCYPLTPVNSFQPSENYLLVLEISTGETGAVFEVDLAFFRNLPKV